MSKIETAQQMFEMYEAEGVTLTYLASKFDCAHLMEAARKLVMEAESKMYRKQRQWNATHGHENSTLGKYESMSASPPTHNQVETIPEKIDQFMHKNGYEYINGAWVERQKRKMGKVVRATIFEYSVTAVIRWCGAQGWNFEDTGVMLATMGAGQIADTTIRLQLRAGKTNDPSRGPAAPVTDSQARILKNATK